MEDAKQMTEEEIAEHISWLSYSDTWYYLLYMSDRISHIIEHKLYDNRAEKLKCVSKLIKINAKLIKYADFEAVDKYENQIVLIAGFDSLDLTNSEFAYRMINLRLRFLLRKDIPEIDMTIRERLKISSILAETNSELETLIAPFMGKPRDLEDYIQKNNESSPFNIEPQYITTEGKSMDQIMNELNNATVQLDDKIDKLLYTTPNTDETNWS